MSSQNKPHLAKINGKKGEEWLKSIPGKITKFEKRWQIKIGNPFPFSYNYTAPGVCGDGTPIVLKLGFPGDNEFINEIEALKVFDGKGSVKLLGADEDEAVMLLEKLEPGAQLSELEDDEEATRIAARLMKKLWKKVPAGYKFPTLEEWFRGLAKYDKLFKETGPIPQNLIDKATKISQELLNSQSDPVLLHGDLHHHNILTSKREPYLAIDPKGLIGEPSAEVAALMNNPRNKLLKMPNPAQILKRRLEILADELELNKKRLLNWSFAESVLFAVWSFEDNADVQHSIKVAEILSEINF